MQQLHKYLSQLPLKYMGVKFGLHYNVINNTEGV